MNLRGRIIGAAAVLGLIAAPSFVIASNGATPAPSEAVARVETCKLDRSSYCTIEHGFGVKPTAILIQELGPGQNATVVESSVTAESYRVKFLWHDGRAFPNEPTIRFYAHYDLPRVDNPPTTSTPPPTTTTTPPTTAAPPTTSTPPPTTATTQPTSPPATTAPPTGGTCKDPVYSSDAPDGGWSASGMVHVNNEVWNATESGPQSIHVCSEKSWYVVSDQPKPGADRHSIKSYPDTQTLFYSPQLGSLKSLMSTWSHDGPAVGEWDWAYDIWMNNWGTELMVWTQHRYGGDRPAKLPPGDAQETATVTIDGTSYKAWRRDNGSYIALVADQQKATGSVDLLKVFQWLIGKGWLKSTATLQAIDYGVEIADTGGKEQTFRLNDYTLTSE